MDIKSEISNKKKELENIKHEIKQLEEESRKKRMRKFSLSDKKYVVEKKMDGFRILSFRNGDDVKLITDTKHDATDAFPQVVKSIKKLSDKDFIVDGEMVAYKNGKPTGRAGLIKSIQAIKAGKKITPDTNYKYKIFDIVYYDNKSLAGKPWHKRQDFLAKLKFKKADNIKKVASTVVNSKKDLIKAAKMKQALQNSEGAMVKVYDSKYPTGGKTSKWIKYKYQQTVYGRVYKVDPVEGQDDVWNYNYGIDISKKFAKKVPDKFKVKYKNKILLDLGRTFNTSVKAKKGDIIQLKVEEVWRHEKNGKVRFSIHKPRVEKKTDKKSPSSIDDLDKFVVSRGQKVSTMSKDYELFTSLDNNHFHLWKPFSDNTSASRDHTHKINTEEGITDKKQKHTHLLASYKGDEWEDRFDIWQKWYQHVNMTESELEDFVNSPEGKKAGLSKESARKKGIKSGRESAEMLLTMIPTGKSWKSVKENWTPKMWEWAKRQYSFIKRMKGVKGPLEKDGEKTRKYLALLLWGHNPKRDLREKPEKPKKLDIEELQDDEEGGTRSETATRFWEKQWHKQYPKDGKGKYIYQQHFRGLTKEESKMSFEELIGKKGMSVHGDFRGEINKDQLWGHTVFLGTSQSNDKLPTDDKLLYMAKNKGEEKIQKLQGHWKLRMPYSWINVGKEKPAISPPGGVGSTKKGYSKFFALDYGTYKTGVWHRHYFEIFLNGKEMKGRMIIMYAPVGKKRVWLVDFPESQKPTAKQKTLDQQVKELKKSKSKHKYLIWNNPESKKKPKKIDITKYKPKGGK